MASIWPFLSPRFAMKLRKAPISKAKMKQSPKNGALLSTSPPQMDEEALRLVLAQHYGLYGPLRRLTSERDLNFALKTADHSYVVKLANPAEPASVTEFQTMALLHLAAQAPHLPVPRVVRGIAGETQLALPQGILRVLTYLDGVPLHMAPRSARLHIAIAQAGAALARGLADFHHPAADHVLQWDIKQAAALRPMLGHIQAPDLQALAVAALDRFDAETLPALAGLPWQVVHADLNPHNILVSPSAVDRVAGILDFGDMVRTPRVCDLAVAASYQIDPQAPLQSLHGFARAWHDVNPLLPAETAVLFDLVAIRMVTTLAIASWRAAQYPENAAYILRNMPSASAGLRALAAVPRGTALATLKEIR